MKRIAFVGSGSGGHFYPLIAVAEVLRQLPDMGPTQAAFYFIGPDIFDQEALQRTSITYVSCPAGKQRRYFSLHNVVDFFKTIAGFFVAFGKLFWLYPDAVFSKGGFTSVPVVLSAWLLRIPIIVHESDAVAGRANLLAKRFARTIFVAHQDAARFFPAEKVQVVGMPLRREFFAPVATPHDTLKIPDDKPVIFVTGGSLGAKRLNDLMLNSLDELLPHYTVIHQAGRLHQKTVAQAARALVPSGTETRYHLYGQLSPTQVAAALEVADVVVSRAGSTSIFEIAYKRKPAVLIPIPEAVSRDQRTNAYAYARSGAATVLEEHNLTDDLFLAEVRYILDNEDVCEKMRHAAAAFATPDAARDIATHLAQVSHTH